MADITAHVLATGDELVSGSLVDTNSAHIARELEDAGADVVRHVCVGDDMERLVQALRETSERADLAVVTGGLGPTMDDLSAEAAARAAGVELVLDEVALAWIRKLFVAIDRPMNPSNEKQAWLPEGAQRLDNPVGTAPGFAVTIGRCLFFFVPGVPHEMRRMVDEQVLPRVRERLGSGVVHAARTLTTFGAPESAIGERVENAADGISGMHVGIRADFPYIYVKLYARAASEDEAAAMLDRGAARVEEAVGEWMIAPHETTLSEVLGGLLRERGATLAVAESCTGGLIGHWITQVSGSSDYFLMSAVTYANEVKQAILGVSGKTLAGHGAVSEQTAREMAEGARRAAGATYGISTTGIAGPSGGSDEKPVGTVCVGLAGPDGSEGRRYFFPIGGRERHKGLFAMAAMEVLRRRLLGLAPPDWPEHKH